MINFSCLTQKNIQNFIGALQNLLPSLVLLGSEEETRLVARNYQEISALGHFLTFDNPNIVELMLDKYELLKALKSKNVSVGEFFAIDDLNDLSSVFELGYPEKKVVIKPRHGAGSRGVMILDDKQNHYQTLVPERLCGTGTFEAVKNELISEGISTGYLAMPFFGPDTFDVDSVSANGTPLIVCPRLREYVNPLSPINEGCRMHLQDDSDVIDYVTSICAALEIDGVADFDVARNDDGHLYVLDASCRFSGSVVASGAINLPIIDTLIAYKFGLPLPAFDKRASGSFKPYSDFIYINT